MNILFNKAKTLALVFMSVSTIYSASAPITEPIAVEQSLTITRPAISSVRGDPFFLEGILDAAKAPPANFSKCVLNFSTTGEIEASVFKIVARLLTDFGVMTGDSHERLYFTDFAYLTSESLAAFVRKSPKDYPKLYSFFKDNDSVYDAFGKIIKTIDTTEMLLSCLADLEKCKVLVNQSIAKTIPLIVDEIARTLPPSALPSAEVLKITKAEITNAAAIFTPLLAKLLNKSYIALSKTADAAKKEVKKLEDAIDNCSCSCFPWCK